MTEFELTDLLNQRLAIYYDLINLVIVLVSVYLTIMFAYIVSMFVAGKRLTSQQVWVATVLFICCSGYTVLHVVETMGHINMISNVISRNLVDLGADEAARGWDAPKGIGVDDLPLVALFAAGIVAALYFTWSVRNKRRE